MPIFAFIFGYSLILMKLSLERKGLRVKSHLFRRALVLIGFGVLHIVFLWDGDILTMYGGTIIFLLFFVNRKPKTLIIWAGVILSLVLLFIFTSTNTEGKFELLDPEMKDSYLSEFVEVHTNGTYGEIMYFRNLVVEPINLDEPKMASVILVVSFIFIPMFLLGMFAAHKRFLVPSVEKKRLYWLTAIILIPLGLAVKLIVSYIGGILEFTEISGIVLATGYIGLFAYLYTVFSNSRLTTAFENVGKLSLTNYIMQTIICTFIFYGYGLGYFGKMGVINGFILGLGIFAIQVVCSTIYLKYFKQGPLEIVLRTLVYMKLSKR